MRMRWGPGPVFVYECTIAARRWQTYALRTLAAILPGAALTVVWWMELGDRPLTINDLAEIGKSFFIALTIIQLTLVLLASPAYTAGSICQDKMRGTLLHLLATDLSNAEVVLGKLAARLLPVLGLVLAAAPVLFGAVLLGGIPPAAAVGALVIMLGAAVLGSALALTLSVWLRKTHEVLLLVYSLLILSLLLLPMWDGLESQLPRIGPPPRWLEMSNPYILAFLPYSRPGAPHLGAQLVYLGMALALSAALTGVAVLRVRAVTIRQGGRPQRTKHRGRRLWPALLRWLPGPSLDGNPVLWREWHRQRLSFWSGLAWALYGGLALLFSLGAIAESWIFSGRHSNIPPFVNAFQVPIGLLLLSISSVTSLAEERGRGSLDVLLTTPLSTLQILQGKWWGAYRTVFLLVLLPALVATVGALSRATTGEAVGVLLLAALILAYGAAATSMGLALATWISRQGRALAGAVIVLVSVTVVPLLILSLFGSGRHAEGVASLSPFFGMGDLTDAIGNHYVREEKQDTVLVWNCFWLAFYLAAAIALFYLTWTFFPLSLGRIDDRRPPNRGSGGAR